MTDYARIYDTVSDCRFADYCDEDKAAILDEMRQIEAAATDEDAAGIIAHWGIADPMSFVRRARALMSGAKAVSNLPPLPEPAIPEAPVFGCSVDVYTDEQMHAYALQYAAQVEAERDALREDAERYRWLRDQCDRKDSAGTRIASRFFGFEWDAAIDAARKAEA